ncbi:hypothetical protein C463_13054 [Halorubrum californiense DSM 19288]|uniref:DUF2795 domain-containing protein n=2 Tax=Haloferacaceae TaxID=1644056 RepID=M0E482_9EURY|nr:MULTISPECIES: hypothetical protein [Halorubrum]ELZ41174.1 hypothetical protein C463_13054 [Halorubrum californiense DSM 19288]TKX69770.1 hypothetical protein EXE40_10230 [Halorubrum sp. GN11GM_10-3_MGM]
MSGDTAEHDPEAHDPAPAVTFGPLKRALREHRYPVTAAELIEQYGAAKLETSTTTTRLDSLLEGSAERQFRDPSEVREAILDALGHADASPEAPADEWTELPR